VYNSTTGILIIYNTYYVSPLKLKVLTQSFYLQLSNYLLTKSSTSYQFYY